MLWQFSADFKDMPVTTHFTISQLAARTGQECLHKTAKTILNPHKNHPNFRVQGWAGYTFCYLLGWLICSFITNCLGTESQATLHRC